jgi:pimeloyl-ACP methyl ester carboxylesterase
MLLDSDHRDAGAGSPVLVLPSFGFTQRATAAVFEPTLSQVSGLERLYVDLPGTGGSPPVEPSSEAVLESVIETADHFEGRPFLVVGWSYGGFLALALARRLPASVRGLLLVCTAPKVHPDERDLTDTLDSCAERGWLDGVDTDLHDHFRVAVGRQEREVADRIAATLALNGARNDRYLTRLRTEGFVLSDQEAPTRLDIPINVLAGRRDRIAGFLPAMNLCRHHPDADLTILARAGHYLPLEEPDRFTQEALSWLKRLGIGT